MKPFEIDTTSWHWRLATVYGTAYSWRVKSAIQHNEYSMCNYVVDVFVGIVYAAIFTAVGGAVVTSFVEFSFWLFTLFTLGQYPMNIMASFGAAILMTAFVFSGFVGIVLLVSKVLEKRRDRLHAAGLEEKPSFIGTAYDSIKGRFCIPLKVKS